MALCAAAGELRVQLQLLAALSIASAFNIDTRFPVLKRGPPDSYFGYSVALHRQLKGQDRHLLLVGAPKAEGLPDQLANRTGALFYCPITSREDDCVRADFETPTDLQKESKEDQWLGVTVASQGPGGKVLVCAHRYEKRQKNLRGEKRNLLGRCFVMSDDIAIDQNDYWDTTPAHFCENVGSDHQGLLMCQQGMAGGFTHPNHYAYYGAPGGWNWQGAVYVEQKNSTFFDLNILSDGPFRLPDLKKGNSYIGYSLMAGQQILSQNSFSYVAGGPRYDHTGAVFLLEQSKADDLKMEKVIRGNQTGSYFGSTVAVADLNNDNWKDLIVGAPHYFDHKKEIGGAVYIYMNEVGKFPNQHSLILNGTLDSLFGHVVSSIGDVNQDGFQDIAVGAPYDGDGKVYIYHGGARGLEPKPSQIIDGKHLNGGIQTFGYSISGNLDVDSNTYPDILIGTLSDKVTLLRSRPVINIKRNFTVHPETIDPSKCTEKSCITVELCFSYLTSTRKYNRNITLNYTLKAERERRSAPRVQFVKTMKDELEGFFSMPKTKCQKIELNLMNTVQDKLHPISITLTYDIYRPVSRGRQYVRSLDQFPVLNVQQTHNETREIHFEKDCGSDRVCHSNLQMMYEFGNFGKDEKFDPVNRLQNKQILEFDGKTKRLALQVNVSNFLNNSDTIGEDAHQAFLNITLPNTLSYSGVRADSARCNNRGQNVLCSLGNPFKKNQEMTLSILVQTKLIDLHTREINVMLQLTTESVQKDLMPVTASMLVQVELQVSLSREHKTHLAYFSGSVMGESAMKTFDDVGSSVDFTFQVVNIGEPLGNLGELYLSFLWPHEISNGKWLLYLTEIEMNGTDDQYCVPEGNVVNPLNLMMAKQTKQAVRRKREAVPAVDQEKRRLLSHAKAKDNLELECNNKHTANCRKFQCLLSNMTDKATVTLRARVWKSTFLEEYSDFSRIIVQMEASLYLKTNISTIKMDEAPVKAILYVMSNVDEEQQYEIPLWIIIVAVLAGVLLLSLIVLLLWKCGFFKRASTRAMYEAKEQKAEMKIQPSETERLTDDD
ncbi:integrin alpha-3b isoform X2 [Callorhinchus milii]|uniref:Integrin alpha-3 n=1 Tax=Callorhinchus milii TaxID=7868 RepID=V9KBC1_CALMI|nr:integrin alpha-3b isoform X2 [Callorhinchus milii]|eukprot:gi/632967035/ref/XP_007899749.1/ PREDICTED: integrin alpha-3 isoform X2 [Callorhinchus milii]